MIDSTSPLQMALQSSSCPPRGGSAVAWSMTIELQCHSMSMTVSVAGCVCVWGGGGGAGVCTVSETI